MRRLLLTLFLSTLLSGCGLGEVGQPCQGGAAENDCVPEAICTLERSEEVAPPARPNNESFTCRALCDTNAACTEPGFLCLRAEGTMYNSCQPDPNAPPPSME